MRTIVLRHRCVFLSIGFALCCAGALAQPANNDPCGAVPLAANTTCTNTLGTNVAATATGGVPAPGCANYSGGDVWYTVTVPASGQVTIATSTSGGINDTGVGLYTAPGCAGPFTLAGCDDDSGPGLFSTITWTGAPGTVLYVRVWEFGNNAFGTFNICATTPPPPPPNNDICSATAVSVGATCSYTTYTNVLATNSPTLPAPGCGGFGATSLDVWFTFTAPPTGIAVIQTQAGTLANAAMALYYDAPPLGCAGPHTLVECDDDDGPSTMPFLNFTNLVPGGTYYLRVWGFGTASGTFGLCLYAPLSVPAGDCVYILELFDTFGDGWGSSSVGISINGGPFTPYTITGSYGVWLIGLNIGQILVVQYTATGPNQTQNRYELGYYPGGNLVFYSGTPPAAGISFAQTIDCQPPPAQPTDCIGAITICSNNAFNNNSNNTGSFVDLNASNYGCLVSAERQGTWYTFSPSAGGNVAFTIGPSNATDDYDFAIWGPYPPGSTPGSVCPPAAQPIRCSYSALTGNTGLNYTATDQTEGAGGDKWVDDLAVTVGQVYVLYVSNWSQSGVAFNLSWNLTNGASLACTVLPVDLLSFTGTNARDGIALEWITGTELGSAHFDVERSADGNVFAPIGTVDAAGTSAQAIQYALLDRTPLHGMNYYRLRQWDLNGEATLSNTITARWLTDEAMTVYPVPGGDELSIAMNGGVLANRYHVIDATGRVVIDAPGDGPHIRLDTRALPGGAYAVHALGAQDATIAVARWIKR